NSPGPSLLTPYSSLLTPYSLLLTPHSSLLFLEGLQVALDLPGVDLKVFAIDLEPLLDPVAGMLGVAPGPIPLLFGQPPQERHGVGANGAYRGEGGLQREIVIPKHVGPAVLVVSHDERIVFPQQVANPHVGVGLAVGTVDDDFVNRPLAGGGPELEGLSGHLGQGGLENLGAILVALDEGGSLDGGHI